MLRIDKVIKPWKEAAALERSHQSLRSVERDSVSDQERRRGDGASRRRCRLRKPGSARARNMR